MPNNVLWSELLGPRPELVYEQLSPEQQRIFEHLREVVAHARRQRFGYDLVMNALFADDGQEGAIHAIRQWLVTTEELDARDLAASCYGIDGRILVAVSRGPSPDSL